jgi:hypothetical protein
MEVLVAEAAEGLSIGSAMTGHDAVGTPMRTVVSAAAGEVPVKLLCMR